MKNLLCALLAAWICVGVAAAGTICPAVTPNPGITDPSGCNVLITFPAVGSPTTLIVDTHPYEGIEDQLVGVINNSSSTITSFVLTGSNLFGFDGDGICVTGFIPAGYCTAQDSTGYGPGGTSAPFHVTFSAINVSLSSGTVNFAPGIPPGSNGFFSLEEAPGGTITVGPTVPEPGTVVTLGIGLIGLAIGTRKRLFGVAKF